MLGQFYALVYLEPNQNRGCWSRFIHIAHFGLALLAHDALLMVFKLCIDCCPNKYTVCLYVVCCNLLKRWFESILFHSILGAPIVLNRILQMKISMSGAWRSIAFTAQEDVDSVDPGWRGCYDECVSGVLLVSFPVFVYVCVSIPANHHYLPWTEYKSWSSVFLLQNPQSFVDLLIHSHKLKITQFGSMMFLPKIWFCQPARLDPRGCLKSTLSIIFGRFW